MTARIGIDLGGTKIEGVVLAGDGTVVRRERIATEQQHGYEHIVERVADLVARLRPDAPSAAFVGIGTPGALTATGLLKNSNTVCLNGRPFRADLERRLGLGVRIENDANCFALAEASLGAGRGAKLVFGVILGTGVGGGIVHRGELIVGPQRLAGEWGHHCIDADGPLCFCGKRGCVETLIAGPAIAAHYRARTGRSLRPEEIIAAARAGEAEGAAELERFLDRFGRALANVIDILDPDAVVLGGGLSRIDELYDRGIAAVARYVCNDELLTPILRHRLGDSAGVIGAALLPE